MSEYVLSRTNTYSPTKLHGRATVEQDSEIYAPTEALQLVAEVAHILRDDPDSKIRLTDPIPDAWGTAGRIVYDIVTQTRGKSPDYIPQATFANRPKGIDTCKLAEPNFLRTLGALASSMSWTALSPHKSSRGANPSVVHIVVNEEGVPVLLQKNDKVFFGEKSALSLEPITVGKVVWPAGMIMSMARVDAPTVSRKKPVIIPVQSLHSIGPVRLASFGLPPDERDAFSVHSKGLANAIRNTKLEAFRRRARQAVARA